MTPESMRTPAVFQGIQPGFLNLEPVELFTLLAPLGVHPAGSTVSRQTLEAHGYRVEFRQPPAARSRTTRVFAEISRVGPAPCLA